MSAITSESCFKAFSLSCMYSSWVIAFFSVDYWCSNANFSTGTVGSLSSTFAPLEKLSEGLHLSLRSLNMLLMVIMIYPCAVVSIVFLYAFSSPSTFSLFRSFSMRLCSVYMSFISLFKESIWSFLSLIYYAIWSRRRSISRAVASVYFWRSWLVPFC